jgi:hypothetical protein
MQNQTYEILNENLTPIMSFPDRDSLFIYCENKMTDERLLCRRVLEINMVKFYFIKQLNFKYIIKFV